MTRRPSHPSQRPKRWPLVGCAVYATWLAACGGGGAPAPGPVTRLFDPARLTLVLRNVSVLATSEGGQASETCVGKEEAVRQRFASELRAALLQLGVRVQSDPTAGPAIVVDAAWEVGWCNYESPWGTAKLELFGNGELLATFSQVTDSTRPLAVYMSWLAEQMLGSDRLAMTVSLPAPSGAAAPAPAAAAPPGSSGAARLQRPAKMAVLPLRQVGSVDVAVVQLLSGLMLSHLDEVAGLQTVGRDDMEAVLGVDRQRAALGCDNLACMAEIGGALGVDLVLYGELGRLGAKYNINLNVVRTQDGTVAARASLLVEQQEEAVAAGLPVLVSQIVDKLNR